MARHFRRTGLGSAACRSRTGATTQAVLEPIEVLVGLGAPVVSPHALPPPGRLPLLVSTARDRIRAELRRCGYRECVDFVCAA